MANKKESFKRAGDKAKKKVAEHDNMNAAMMWIASKIKNTRRKIGNTQLRYIMMMLLSMAAYKGGSAIADTNHSARVTRNAVNKENPSDDMADADNAADVAFFDRMLIDPNAPEDQWQASIDAIQPYVIAHTFMHEQFIDHVYSDNGSRGTKTIGAGVIVNSPQRRKFVEEVLGRKLTSNMRITVQEAKRLADAIYRKSIYPNMRRAFNVPIPARLFLALAIASYNAGSSQYVVERNSGHAVVEAVNNGADVQQVMDIMIRQFGKNRGTQWGGLPNKYAVLAMFVTKRISNETILNSIAGALYSLERDVAAYQLDNNMQGPEYYPGRLVRYQNAASDARAVGYFVPDSIEEMLLDHKEHKAKGTLQKAVRHYMTPEEVRVMERGGVFRRVDSGAKDAKYVEELSRDAFAQVTPPRRDDKAKKFNRGTIVVENAAGRNVLRIKSNANDGKDS